MMNPPKEFDFFYLQQMQSTKDYNSADPEVLGAQVVFKGTRVSVESLFHHVEKGGTIYAFFEDFPSVSRNQAVGALENIQKKTIFVSWQI